MAGIQYKIGLSACPSLWKDTLGGTEIIMAAKRISFLWFYQNSERFKEFDNIRRVLLRSQPVTPLLESKSENLSPMGHLYTLSSISYPRR